MFATLRDSSTADLSQVLADVKKYASEVVEAESRELRSSLKQSSEAAEHQLNERFRSFSDRLLEESGTSHPEGGRKVGDTQLLRKMTNRMTDFEAQVSSQLQALAQDVEKKISFMGSQPLGVSVHALREGEQPLGIDW
ncbi:unnamed protein product [Durusdinium trenchii]|uniref:Uncharacterized protein n=1 Tax=Durusdinium trenchii TaxID=1381693 RepID=A0ABP0SMI7_9DINO